VSTADQYRDELQRKAMASYREYQRKLKDDPVAEDTQSAYDQAKWHALDLVVYLVAIEDHQRASDEDLGLPQDDDRDRPEHDGGGS
jgi:hypothetical protein